jgi:MFS family permease
MTAATAEMAKPQSMWEPMQHTGFRRFFAAAVVSNAGSLMQGVAVPFTVFEITNSKTWLGVSAFTGMFVGMLANAPGGMLADRYSRRKVLVATQSIQMFSAVSLVLLWSFGRPTIGALMPLLVIGAIGGGLNLPVWQSFIPSLVPRAEIPAAIRLNSMQFAVARSAGPVLGAVILKSFGASACFAVNAASFLVLIAVLLVVPDGEIPMAPRLPLIASRVVADIADGWRYMAARPGLRYAPMAVFVNAAFGFGLITLAPAIARDQLGRTADDNGLLVGAFGVGGAMGVVLIGMAARRSRNSRQVRLALLCSAVAGVVLMATGSFWIVLASFAVAGFANSVGATALNTSVQMQVDDAFRGRVMSVYTQMFFVGSAFGSLILGVLAELTSLEAAAGLSAAVFVAFHVWSVVRFDGLKVLDTPA